MSTNEEQSNGGAAAAPSRVICVACGSPYISERQAARLQEKLGLSDDVIRHCPGCRRQQHLRALEARCCAARTDAVG